MTEELKVKIDKYVKDTCVYYRSTHEDMLPNQFEKYLRSACVHFATEATKELEAQIEKMKCCENCQHHYFDNYDVISCAEEKEVTSKKCKFWELSIERR